MAKKVPKKERFSRPSPDKPGKEKPKPSYNPSTFLRFTGIGFEMLATIGVGVVAGYYADKFLALKFPVFLLTFSFVSLFGSLYLLYKRLPKD